MSDAAAAPAKNLFRGARGDLARILGSEAGEVDRLLAYVERVFLDYRIERCETPRPSLVERRNHAKEIAATARRLSVLMLQVDSRDEHLYAEPLGRRVHGYAVAKWEAGDDDFEEAMRLRFSTWSETVKHVRALGTVANSIATVRVPPGRKLDPHLAKFGFRVWEVLRLCKITDSSADGSRMHQAFHLIFEIGEIESTALDFLKALKSWRKTEAEYGELPWVFKRTRRAQRPLQR